MGGLCAGFGILGGVPHPAHLTVRDGLDVAAVARLETAFEEHPISLLGGLLFHRRAAAPGRPGSLRMRNDEFDLAPAG